MTLEYQSVSLMVDDRFNSTKKAVLVAVEDTWVCRAVDNDLGIRQ